MTEPARGLRETLPRLLRTVRHLRPSQLAWRARYAMERRHPTPFRKGQIPPDARVVATDDHFPDLTALDRGDVELTTIFDDLQAGVFDHLNQRKRLGPPPVDWLLGPRYEDRLWTITLHYHRWLDLLAEVASARAAEAEDVEQLIELYLDDWLRRCDLEQPGARALAWNAFAIATRLGWWTRAYRRLRALNWHERHPALHERFVSSYWKQAAYLERHLEWDLRANHLLRDAIGLLWAGRFFDHEIASRWLAKGTALVLAQAEEQVLPDGGHFERSPMYHIDVLEDLVTAAMLVRDRAAADRLRETCERMADFSAWLRHPDGEIPLLNDAALGAVSAPTEGIALARAVGATIDPAPRRGGRCFAETGLVVYHDPRWSLFFDVGPVGPDDQPGHAHADTLTVSASLDGRRLLIDPGTHSYDDDNVRRYDRATGSHNTICLDGQDSSEVWHVFRVGRRARVHDARVAFTDAGIVASAWHDGYGHLPGRPRHERRVELSGRALVVRDHVRGSGTHEVAGGFLLAPGWEAEPHGRGWRLVQGDCRLTVTIEGPEVLILDLVPAPYHPEYGLETEAPRLCWTFRGPLPVAVTTRLEAG